MTDANLSGAIDLYWMAAAVRLARRGCFTTFPNPRVGSVLVQGGVQVGAGWHHQAGQAHAEVAALANAGSQARGATLYVTLEPCAHTGRTGPCAEALIAAGIRRVVVGMIDPNPLVAGRGVAMLGRAGIAVSVGVLESECESLNPGFIRCMRGGRPWIRVKSGSSMDGRTALANGVSQWITGPSARADVQRLRAASSAVLTGSGTVLADDPLMNVRLAGLPTLVDGALRQPRRVLLDSRLRVGVEHRLFADPAHPPLVFTSLEGGLAHPERLAALQQHAEVVQFPGTQLSLVEVFEELRRRHYHEILVEAGPTLTGRVIELGLFDEWIVYQSGLILGGAARPLIQTTTWQALEDCPRLHLNRVTRLGPDLRLDYRNSIPEEDARDSAANDSMADVPDSSNSVPTQDRTWN